MTKLLLTLLTAGLYMTASAQCQADFTYSVSNDTVTFTNTSTGTSISSFWTFGDGTNSYQNNPWHQYITTDNFTVCLSIYDSISQCQSSFCDTIFVQADTTGNGCISTSSTTVNQNGTIIGTASGANMYQWTIYNSNYNLIYSSNSSSFSYNPGMSGMYTVCLNGYDSLQNICDSNCYQVTVIDSTGGPCNLTSNAYSSGGSIIGTASGAYGYQWTIYNSNYNLLHTSNNNNLNYSPGSNGSYTVCLNGYDSLQNICDSICYQVSVFDSLAGLSTSHELNFSVYPNPTEGMVYLEVSDEQIASIILIDITGSVLLSKDITETATEIDLSLYPKGLYFIHALGRKGQRLSTSKVLRQ